MGNRAFIAHQSAPNGIYLHWNGGMDSIKPLLDYCALVDPYGGFNEGVGGLVTFVTVANNMLGSSIHIEDNSASLMLEDNGTYWVEGWEIVGRETPEYFTQEQDSHDYWDMMMAIATHQPRARQIPLKVITSEVATKDNIHDAERVLYRDYDEWKEVSIIGFTDDNQPIIDMFNGGKDNFSNIVRDLSKVRVVNEENLNKAMESLEKMAEDYPTK